jgi:hypothetical protein
MAGDDRRSRFEAAARPMKITPPVRARLDIIKDTMETEKQRQVTYSEVLDELVRAYEMLLDAAAQAAARDDLDRVTRQ